MLSLQRGGRALAIRIETEVKMALFRSHKGPLEVNMDMETPQIISNSYRN